MAEHSIRGSFGYSPLSPLYELKAWQKSPNDPLKSNHSSDTVQHNYDRKLSLSSKGSVGGAVSGPLQAANENVSPSRSTSLSTMHFFEASKRPSSPENVSKAISRNSSWDREAQNLRCARDYSTSFSEAGTLEDIDLNAGCGEASQQSSSDSDLDLSKYRDHGLSFEIEKEETLSTKKPAPTTARETLSSSPSIIVTDTASHPITRLFSNLRHRHSKNIRSLSVRKERWSLDDFDEDIAADLHHQHVKPSGHKKTSSWASSGFVAAVKSATTNLGTLSAPSSQRTRRFAPLRNSKRSSKLSQVTNQESVNGNQDSISIFDEAAWDRAVQRRRTLEELISSEESYIADLKVLKNASVLHRFGPPTNANHDSRSISPCLRRRQMSPCALQIRYFVMWRAS